MPGEIRARRAEGSSLPDFPGRQYFETHDRVPLFRLGMALLITMAIAGAALSFLHFDDDRAATYILILLALLSVVGLFALVAMACGVLRFTRRYASHPVLTSLVETAFDGILLTDQQGSILYANKAYLDLTGAASGGDVQSIERMFIGEPDVSEAIYRLLKAAREKRRLQEEVRVSRIGNGQHGPRWLRLRVRPLEGYDERLTVWSVSDVTHERARQENVFQELQQAIDYLDHAPAGFFSVDAEGNIIYLNATLANWLDRDLADAAIGSLKLSDIIAGEGAALLATLSAQPGKVQTEVLDLDLRTGSGKLLPVRLVHKVAYGADGRSGPSRTLVLNRAENDGRDLQRAAELRFTRFFQNAPMAIATIDKSGRIVRANARFAATFNETLKGGERSIVSVVASRDRAALEALLRKASEDHVDIAPVEAALIGQGERWANFFVAAAEGEDPDGEAAIVYVFETTAQRSIESHFYQQQKMDSVGQLAGGIAHDFNNVLSAIMMATDFLLNSHKPTDVSFKDIMHIKQNANRAAALVRHLLAFSRKQTMRPQILDFGAVVDDLGMLLKRLIGEKITLDIVHGRDLWPVKADNSQLEQVIINLAVNARDAMPDGGRLSLRTSNIAVADSFSFYAKGLPAADYVLLEVCDTGSGIPPEIISKIFEPFFTTKEVGKGTGLGLSTVYGIIKQTGGFIFAESEPGRTCFRIFLPRHIAEAPESWQSISAAVGAAAVDTIAAAESLARTAHDDLTGQGRILLVEDEVGLRALNARGLASRGYTVLEAGNGLEAIAVFERDGQIDLVVSDVVMPEMDGPALLKELRRRDPKVKVIFVSGYAEEAFANLSREEQYAFLSKPFTLKQLVEEVKKTLAQ